MITPRTPSGVLELLPAEQAAFRRLERIIRTTYERFGFIEIETPVFERSEVLLTKSGGETERQIYFVSSTGTVERDGLPDLALRFDLTVPLARYVAEHQNDLAFPFKRYQIQRVYRGERSQRGRFREFYQCDIDVVGRDSLSLRHDAEIPAVIHEVFAQIGVGPFTIRVNHRGLMEGLLADLGLADPELRAAALREVDKLDKRGVTEVEASLRALGLAGDVVDSLLGLVQTRIYGAEPALAKLESLQCSDQRAVDGRRDLSTVFASLTEMGVPDERLALDLGIARGLEYYTGTVYETTLDDHPDVGSVCSGGRYDDLASLYTGARLPGVGISIGLTRLFWQLREAGLLDPGSTSVQAYVTIMDDVGVGFASRVATALRAAGVNTDLASEPGKLGKQLKHADRIGARFAVIAGEDERAGSQVTIKDLTTGEQSTVEVEAAAEYILRNTGAS